MINNLEEIIENQKNLLSYNSHDSTFKHKFLIYESFKILLDKYPEDMRDYLFNNSRSGGFQAKLFQEYTKLLESSLPFSFVKNKKIFVIKSLLDENLNIFNGISTFNSIVNENLKIKNCTEEFYIGGRKATYSKPFYIGKLIDVIDIKTSLSLMKEIEFYTFSYIKLKIAEINSTVKVTHLRVIPHYQIGGMLHINRIRKDISNELKGLKNAKTNSNYC